MGQAARAGGPSREVLGTKGPRPTHPLGPLGLREGLWGLPYCATQGF